MAESIVWACQGERKDSMYKITTWIYEKWDQLINILSGKDKNWDGQVDIKDHMMEAEEKTKNG